MTFLQDLYGCWFYEIPRKEKDGNKDKLHANFFMTALILFGIFAFLMLCSTFISGFNEELTKIARSIFGYSSGRAIGKLLAIPLLPLSILS
jgi:hypothetical protein